LLQVTTKPALLAWIKNPTLLWWTYALKAAGKGIETARWLREVCGTSVVFVTANNDKDTTTRIHGQVPGAPMLSKLTYRDGLSAAVAEVTKAAGTAPFAG
jgi:hypothetical protein